MILLPCPWCGHRNVTEFHYLGEVVPRPDPQKTSPEEWRTYLYLRSNPAGRLHETWYHRAGCRRYFEAERDTRDNTVLGTWAPGSRQSAAGSATSELPQGVQA